MKPYALIAAECGNPKLPRNAKMLTAELISREDDAVDSNSELGSQSFRSLKVGSESFWRSSPLKAIKV